MIKWELVMIGKRIGSGVAVDKPEALLAAAKALSQQPEGQHLLELAKYGFGADVRMKELADEIASPQA